MEDSKSHEALALVENFPKKQITTVTESRYEQLIENACVIICNSVLDDTQDLTTGDNAKVMHLLHTLIKMATSQNSESFLNILAGVLSKLNDPKLVTKIIKHFEAALKNEEINSDLSAKILILADQKEDDIGLELANSNNNSAATSIKELINISVLNDPAAKKIAAVIVEPSFLKVRGALVHSYMEKFVKRRSNSKNEVSPKILPFLKSCAEEYLEMTRRNSHPGNVMLLPLTYIKTTIHLVTSLIKLNSNTDLYQKSTRRVITLQTTDGRRSQISIPNAAIGSVWNFYDLVTLSSFIDSSQKKFREDTACFNSDKPSAEKAISSRLFSIEKIQKSLGVLAYDLDFLTQLLVSEQLSSYRENYKAELETEDALDLKTLRQEIDVIFAEENIDFLKSANPPKLTTNLHDPLSKAIAKRLQIRINFFLSRQPLQDNTIVSFIRDEKYKDEKIKIKITTSDIKNIIKDIHANSFVTFLQIERQKYGELYRNFVTKPPSDMKNINEEIVKNIQSTFISFLKTYKTTNQPKSVTVLISSLETCLAELKSAVGQIGARQALINFKNKVDFLMLVYEAVEIGNEIQPRLRAPSVIEHVNQLSNWEQNRATNKDIGQTVHFLFKELDFEQIFSRTKSQTLAMKGLNFGMWAAPGFVGKTLKNSEEINIAELPRKIQGFTIMPPYNLWTSLKQLYEAMLKSADQWRDALVKPLNYDKHPFFYDLEHHLKRMPFLVIEQSFLKDFNITVTNWRTAASPIVKLLDDPDILHKFKNLFEGKFKSHLSEIAQLRFIYNTYQPFITLILHKLYFDKLTHDDLHNIIDQSDQFLKIVLESPTLSAAAHLRYPNNNTQYLVKDSEPVHLRCLNMVSQLGIQPALFQPLENTPDNYFESLAKVFEGMLSTYKFDPNDESYLFLIKHCAVADNRDENNNNTDSNNNNNNNNSSNNQYKVYRNPIYRQDSMGRNMSVQKILSPVVDEIKDFFGSNKKIPADDLLNIGLDLAIVACDDKSARDIIINHCKIKQGVYLLKDIREVFKKHSQGSVNVKKLWRSIDEFDVDNVSEILKGAGPFAISIVTAQDDLKGAEFSKSKEKNPITHALKIYGHWANSYNIEENPKAKATCRKNMQSMFKILEKMVKHCQNTNQLYPIIDSLREIGSFKTKRVQQLYYEALTEMREALHPGKSTSEKLSSFMQRFLLGKKSNEHGGSIDSNTTGSDSIADDVNSSSRFDNNNNNNNNPNSPNSSPPRHNTVGDLNAQGFWGKRSPGVIRALNFDEMVDKTDELIEKAAAEFDTSNPVTTTPGSQPEQEDPQTDSQNEELIDDDLIGDLERSLGPKN